MNKLTTAQIEKASKIAEKNMVIPQGWSEETWADAMTNANKKFTPLCKGKRKIKSIDDVRGKKK